MKKPLPKLFLDVEEVMEMHDKSHSWSYEHLRKIRKRYNVQSHQRVNLYIFCDYEGLPPEEVLKYSSG